MPHVHQDLLTVSGGANRYESGSDLAWQLVSCSFCDGQQSAVIARVSSARYTIRWLRCVSCGNGMVENDGQVAPGAKPLRVPKGVPSEEMMVWDEVRSCLAAHANTAAVMLCRKLLLHLAVAHGLPPKNAKGWAPNFLETVQHLEQEGILTARMRPWVDQIKDVGNEANHELQPVTQQAALDVATFTEQLLVLAYELDTLRGAPPGP